ncbi:MAG: hypothetical protein GY711_31665 [bacterium]|nr:hypothetical protein [bacterium]
MSARVADFCRFGDEIVFACDDAARSEFLNKRRAKGEIAGPEASQSNLWFVAPAQLDALGPAIGRGGVLVDEQVAADVWSDPFLFAGYAPRGAHFVHDLEGEVTFRFEVDAGNGSWRELGAVRVGATATRTTPSPPTRPARGSALPPTEAAARRCGSNTEAATSGPSPPRTNSAA